jgi:acyl dehydratase
VRADGLTRTGWAVAAHFDEYGGFTGLKREATAADAAARGAGTASIAEEVATRAAAIRHELGAIHGSDRARRPEPVPFGEALRVPSGRSAR